MIKTDLNERERERFASAFDRVAESASNTATALRSGDDTKLMLKFVMFSLKMTGVTELKDIVTKSMTEAKAELESKEFPEIIGG
jgi:hypothetical protein